MKQIAIYGAIALTLVGAMLVQIMMDIPSVQLALLS